MMYKPSAFLVATAALTSIFSFFFGLFFRERELTYGMWIKFVAYGAAPLSGDEKKDLCAELESRSRVYYYFKGITAILLVTLIIEFVIFQFYSLGYICPATPPLRFGAIP